MSAGNEFGIAAELFTMSDLAERLKDAYEFACLESVADPSQFWEHMARWWDKNGKW